MMTIWRCSSGSLSSAARTMSACATATVCSPMSAAAHGSLVRFACFARLAGLFAAHEIDRPSMRHDAEVRTQRAHAEIDALRVGPYVDEDILRDVLGQRPVCRYPLRETEDERSVLVEHLAQRRVVARLEARNGTALPHGGVLVTDGSGGQGHGGNSRRLGRPAWPPPMFGPYEGAAPLSRCH